MICLWEQRVQPHPPFVTKSALVRPIGTHGPPFLLPLSHNIAMCFLRFKPLVTGSQLSAVE
jgi:hypothetical protein